MNKSKPLFIIICLFIGVLIIYNFINPLFTASEPFNGFNSDKGNDTVILSASTGDMKGLEVGVASYAGEAGIPLILAGRTVSYPLNEWITLFKDKANIRKVLIVGPVSNWQIFSLKLGGLKIEQIDGLSKAEILTEMAGKTYKSLDTVIITPSDPSASLLGAVMNVPVFVVAEPGKYTSNDLLPLEYNLFISDYHIQKVIIVGNVSPQIIADLKAKNLKVEEIKGNDSFQTSVLVSDRIIDIQKQRGVEVKSAYCGFYGELPSIVPLAVRSQSIILQDPTLHMDETVNYLKNKGITKVIITRNGPADYLQMEEPDFVSSRLVMKLASNGIETSSITSFRTINEATGLYETKILVAESILSADNLWGNFRIIKGKLADTYRGLIPIEDSSYPPLLDIILKGGNWETNTGSQLAVNKIGLNTWFYSWKGIHPYIWHRNNENDWYCYSGTEYSWHWIHANQTDEGINTNSNHDTWTVEYLSNEKVYYRVYWVKKGTIWQEIHTEASYKWQYKFNSWICTKDGSNEYFVLYPVIGPNLL